MEVLTVALLLVAVAGVVLPRYQESRDQADAARAVDDFDALRRAAMDYLAANGEWPPAAPVGEVPPGLEPFLPGAFSPRAEHYALGWEHWTLPDGLPRHPEVRVLAGISLTTDRPRVGEAVRRHAGPGVPSFALNGRYTYLLDGL